MKRNGYSTSSLTPVHILYYLSFVSAHCNLHVHVHDCILLTSVPFVKIVNEFHNRYVLLHVSNGISFVQSEQFVISKDMLTSLLTCLAPICSTAPAVPAYGQRPPSSLSCPTVI